MVGVLFDEKVFADQKWQKVPKVKETKEARDLPHGGSSERYLCECCGLFNLQEDA